MPYHQPDGAPAPSSSQSAYQPPAWATLLAAQGISIHGTPITESHLRTWQRQELAHHAGKSTSSWSRGPQAISAEAATKQRAGTGASSAKNVLGLKKEKGLEKGLM